MKRNSKLSALLLVFMLFAEIISPVQAKEKGKKPDPAFREKASFVDRSNMPYYGKNAVVDTYISDEIFYSVDSASEDVVNIEPETISYEIDATYTEKQLREMAETTITAFLSDKIKFSKLSFSTSKKIGTFFFRWEDANSQLEGGGYPFIQVGFSQNGDFLNLTNTLPFAKQSFSGASKARFAMVKSPNLIGPFNEIYANGGSYWTPKPWTLSSATGGYYSIYPTGCTGTFCSKFYYSVQTTCPAGCTTGKWKPNANTNSRAAAFIPSAHATAAVKYTILRGNNTSFIVSVDQNAYSDTWKLLTSTTISSGVKQVSLIDYGTTAKELAWDELWVYNP